ncbi:MAG: Spy/CpxP family protein refolding chaperone [Desulfuromonadaceae bacterium]|nr:Spy/CpxP family protein refolding chaperone [Desulfuromonadaceae bacterium]
MKRKFLIFTLTTAVMAGAASLALADNTQIGTNTGEAATSMPTHQYSNRFKNNREKKHAAMIELLGLNDVQRAQINAIITAARQNNASLRHKLVADRKKINEMSHADSFDESAVRSLIASDETVRTELMVSRLKVRSQIHAVLTPEQQAKAKDLRLLAPDTQRKWDKDEF